MRVADSRVRSKVQHVRLRGIAASCTRTTTFLLPSTPAKRDVGNLSYKIAVLQADLVKAKDASELKDLYLQYFAQELEKEKAVTVELQETVGVQEVVIAMGIDCVEGLLEKLYRTEVKARDTELQLREDLAAQNDILNTHAAQTASYLQKAAGSLAHISSLEAKIGDDDIKHRTHLSSCFRLVGRAGLASRVTHAAAIGEHRATIAALHGTLSGLEQNVGHGLAKAIKLTKANKMQKTDITELKVEVKGLKS
ncbi:hypothetical protein C8R43DRAFT_1238570 [Mycena crocata]|nr:hypothetical protein C8R43DRAFT_1238570 [Mycena crocata]